MADERSAPASIFTVANALTFSRLVLLPVVIAGIATDHGWVAATSMIVIWVTDLLDGRIARLMRQAGSFGKALDSTVDFVLIYALFIAFYAAGRLGTWQFAILYLAMITILSLQFSLSAAGRGDEVASTTLEKFTGALQYAYLLLLVALEVIPESTTTLAVKTIAFIPLAVAIVFNSVECIARARSMARAPQSE